MRVKLENITKAFPNRKKDEAEVIAVNNFNFEIPDGKLIGLLGPSGCGKSTTLFMLSGLLSPTSGKIFFGDDDVTNLPPEKRGVGLVFQNYALYPHMTVKQNIMFPLQNQKMKKEEIMRRVVEAAKLVQIEDLLERKPSELSGGQQQRVAIARALVKSPNVLLLDEPLSNLDARLRLQTREEIRRIQRNTNVTTIFVTHDQEEAMSISDLIVVMKKGVIQQIDVPQTVYDNPVNLFVAKFLGTPPINVFRGKIANKKVYIGEEEIMDFDAADQEVYIGIRPEGFIVDPKGKLSTTFISREVMGRDSSIVSKSDEAESATIRSIIDATLDVKVSEDNKVRFNIKPNKIFIFNKETEKRIYEGQVEETPVETPVVEETVEAPVEEAVETPVVTEAPAVEEPKEVVEEAKEDAPVAEEVKEAKPAKKATTKKATTAKKTTSTTKKKTTTAKKPAAKKAKKAE